jgi:hypothetical protein
MDLENEKKVTRYFNDAYVLSTSSELKCSSSHNHKGWDGQTKNSLKNHSGSMILSFIQV